MRMGDRDRGNAAQSLYLGDGIAIDEADAVPQNVTGAILDQESTLADSELGLAPNAPNRWPLRIERVAMAGSQFVQSHPLLSLQTDKLALIFADRAAFRLLLGRRELRPAGHTNIGWQGWAPAKRRRQ